MVLQRLLCCSCPVPCWRWSGLKWVELVVGWLTFSVKLQHGSAGGVSLRVKILEQGNKTNLLKSLHQSRPPSQPLYTNWLHVSVSSSPDAVWWPYSWLVEILPVIIVKQIALPLVVIFLHSTLLYCGTVAVGCSWNPHYWCTSSSEMTNKSLHVNATDYSLQAWGSISLWIFLRSSGLFFFSISCLDWELARADSLIITNI